MSVYVRLGSSPGDGSLTERPVLVLGATSAIARAVSLELAKNGSDLFLAGRDLQELWKIASDAQVKYGVAVNVAVFDADDVFTHGQFVESIVQRTGGLGGVVYAIGDLGSQADIEKDPMLARAVMDRNYVGGVSVLLYLAKHFEELRSGFIVGISSVAGDRGRITNYVYGSAKAGFTTFLQGLRNRMNKVGVPVLTVKPGFVDTAMTFGKPGMFLVASPKSVASEIVQAIKKRKDVIYVPGFWRLMMFIIRHIPEKIFKKMKF